MSGEKTKELSEMTLEALLLMMNLADDDFIINVTISEEGSDDE